jgi:hypothetical protein
LLAARVDGNGTERKEKMAVICTGIYVSVGIEVSYLEKNFTAHR